MRDDDDAVGARGAGVRGVGGAYVDDGNAHDNACEIGSTITSWPRVPNTAARSVLQGADRAARGVVQV